MKLTDNDKQSAKENVGNEYLIFTLGQEEYGIEILKVQEIRGYERVTRIANTPDFIAGVTNLRGVIVPVVDFRVKFHLDTVAFDENTVVIVLSFSNKIVGIVVDGVSDVLSLSPEQIRPAPDFSGAKLATDYLLGLGTLDSRMLILVDIEKLLNSEEMQLVERTAEISVD
ncbi:MULTISPECIES: chemotaxis protein CheW [unclassified Escherichia]|uniref:chemotaxis protein CheW n=1 Tax=unclassified Escherichia TaxID=2608889 RepID=UPI0010290573|nr:MULTISPECIES: chemotaxis protein CheW [unclassified Escherichia]RZM89517.1 chemotaxis protein CheW [Escherichia sp. E1V33]RZM98534.1 chemotaxis protein CheW [Escherichia sp. E14V5]RZN00744.1 chemotaxis protein CheW [Escherichia sp. E14V7]RZN18194.1 chemotaxis protein CheW [Escherichia sp. E14S1]RZN23662.1 chemotaxis protein CheW [Escherichia sp. E14V10]